MKRSLTLWHPTHVIRLAEGATVRVGRDTSNDCNLQYDSVSRIHARLTWRAGASCPVIQDLESRNGVQVDGQPVSGEAPLRNGSLVEIGSLTYVTKLAAHTAIEPDEIRGRALLELIEREERTGRLRAVVGVDRLTLWFHEGQIVVGSEVVAQALRTITRLAKSPRVQYVFTPGHTVAPTAARRLRPSDALDTSGEEAWGRASA